MDLDRLTNRNDLHIKELETQLQVSSSRQEEIDILAEMAWELRNSQPERAERIAQKAIKLIPEDQSPPEGHHKGYATALSALAYLDIHSGSINEGVKKCLEALNLVSRYSPSNTVVRVWFTLSWSSFFLGDYPTALEQALKTLDLSQQLGLVLEKAWALDAVASTYGVTGDFSNAMEAHQESIRIFQELDDVDGILRSTNNLAMTHYGMQNYGEAVKYAKQSLNLAKKWDRVHDVLNISCTLAQISIDTRQLKQADKYLQEAFANVKLIEKTFIYHVFVLMEWARLYLLKDDLERAKSSMLLALNVARENNQKSEQAKCHKFLSDIYEREGNYKESLAHHKAFHAINEEVAGERAVIRLSVLTITHQIDSALQEAEIYRLKVEQLQSEIIEQKRIKELMEKLSRVDSLTGLANRRHFDERLSQEYARHSRTGQKLSLILLDLDHFKLYNDAYGHLKGDECLQQIAQVIKSQVARTTDLVARFGGEEFICILPETDEAAVEKIAERIRQSVYDLEIPHRISQTERRVTVSLGIVTAKCHEKGSPVDFIVKADQQLYEAKARGRNQIVASISKHDKDFHLRNGTHRLRTLVWKNSFESGHAAIDTKHQEIYRIFNQLLDLSYTNHLPEHLTQTLSMLFSLTLQHFKEEESVLSQIGYPDHHQHATEHRWLVQRGTDLLQRFNDGMVPLLELLLFVSEEIVGHHILQSDKKFFPFLQNYLDSEQHQRDNNIPTKNNRL